ncbi:MAG: RNA polymerase sigma factor, partial [Muribaculaceae bacterium]|nr:RNA polymerase sigma factor [Muribaculaceae bacterium]
SAGQWKAFILTCIRNQAISVFRSDNAAGNYTEYVRNSSELHEDMLLDYIHRETLSRLYRAIDDLPPDMRELLELSFGKGLKNSEIAARLGVAEITVKKRKARLILMLRKSLPDSAWILLLLMDDHWYIYS